MISMNGLLSANAKIKSEEFQYRDKKTLKPQPHFLCTTHSCNGFSS